MMHRRVLRGWPLMRRFTRARAGNIAVMFSLMLLPMLGAIGLAVDFGQILTARTKAQVAADAAALQASGVARDLIRRGDGSVASASAALVEAKEGANRLFKAHADQSGLKGWQANTVVTRTGQIISAKVDYTVNADTFLAKLFGQNSYTATGAAGSSSSLPSYVDVYVAMDVSQSMGLGATNADMIALYKKVSCVFGCHVPFSGQAVSNQSVARANGIRLRVDVLRDAVKKMVETAANDTKNAAAYRFGLYTMGANPSSLRTSKLTQLFAVSAGSPPLNDDAFWKQIDLGPNNSAGVGDSYFTEPLGALKAIIPTPGDGSAESKRRAYLFMITDGVRDIPGAGYRCKWDHCMGVIDPAVCKGFKDKDIIVGVLYTTYLPIYKNPLDPNDKTLQVDYVTQMVNHGLPPLIRPQLEACASPGWFAEASDAAGIEAAMAKMFARTTIAPTLTN